MRRDRYRIPDPIRAKIGRNLHNQPGHPIEATKRLIQSALPGWKCIDDLPPVVSVRDNYDVLRIPLDHPSRRPSDSYYVDATHVLRTHTSAHQVPLLAAGHERVLVTGDVYRRDTPDRTHSPVFHQTEAVCLSSEPVEDLRGSLFEGPLRGAPRARMAPAA